MENSGWKNKAARALAFLLNLTFMTTGVYAVKNNEDKLAAESAADNQPVDEAIKESDQTVDLQPNNANNSETNVEEPKEVVPAEEQPLVSEPASSPVPAENPIPASKPAPLPAVKTAPKLAPPAPAPAAEPAPKPEKKEEKKKTEKKKEKKPDKKTKSS